MYVPIPSQRSCARAWIAAATALVNEGGEAYNVIIDVDQPEVHDGQDNAIIASVDKFLRDWEQNPISTVANTIFPQALYEAFGAPKFYDEYLRNVYDKLGSSKRWGRYFERIIRHTTKEGKEYNPLDGMIKKLSQQKAQRQMYRCVYELAVYDPLRDGRFLRGGQCLSFLSFKLHPERGLCLTAIYRNHAYVTRCLGNLIGLGRLQGFIAKEAGYPVGSMTCISTHAEIDTGEKENHWGIVAARKLITDAADLLLTTPTRMVKEAQQT
jgi:thymidylate synthase